VSPRESPQTTARYRTDIARRAGRAAPPPRALTLADVGLTAVTHGRPERCWAVTGTSKMGRFVTPVAPANDVGRGVARVLIHGPLCLRPAASVILAACVLVGCGDTAPTPTQNGLVVGALPACYGPGPDLNLTPTRLVQATRDGKVVKEQVFPSDNDHQTYELSLPPGEYNISVPGVRAVRVTVRPGQTSTADIPIPACV